ncbi:MAG TPA: hypothetical protein VHA52_10890 [Candidatus Babeliaceae bacterium]|nr:hypothetical protein [Candidatus Babeliaceae bacterium]
MDKQATSYAFFTLSTISLVLLYILIIGFFENNSMPLLRIGAISLLWLPLTPLQLMLTLGLPSISCLLQSTPWYFELGSMLIIWILISLLKELLQQLRTFQYTVTLALVIITSALAEYCTYGKLIATTWTIFPFNGIVISVYVFIRYLVG